MNTEQTIGDLDEGIGHSKDASISDEYEHLAGLNTEDLVIAIDDIRTDLEEETQKYIEQTEELALSLADSIGNHVIDSPLSGSVDSIQSTELSRLQDVVSLAHEYEHRLEELYHLLQEHSDASASDINTKKTRKRLQKLHHYMISQLKELSRHTKSDVFGNMVTVFKSTVFPKWEETYQGFVKDLKPVSERETDEGFQLLEH